ncbi:reverse transcriptase/maturase family protein [Desulfobacterales bacterium HSG16]|nr:reverse transcriptase/maturase family protein [Desulfobacterales bacterium HSG16]
MKPASPFENGGNLIRRIASDEILEEAFQWLCRQRIEYSPNSDVWDFRLKWPGIKPDLHNRLVSGSYMFSPLSEYRMPDDRIEVWQSEDALVLKAMSIVLNIHLAPVLSDRCFHIKDRGGSKAAVRNVQEQMIPGKFVMKSDVRSYYASIDHAILYSLAERYISDRHVMQLLWRYMDRTVCYGGEYRHETRGISYGCSLSPLMGALYLAPLDEAMEKSGLFYARFMDDWVVIAPSRWKLRKVVSVVNQVLSVLKVEIHPDKTYIGRVEKGFSFLGYFLKPGLLTASTETLKKHAERIARLYEQGADEIRIGQYALYWYSWLKGGLQKHVSISAHVLRSSFHPHYKQTTQCCHDSHPVC